MNTPYDVLGVPRDADDETIRSALRRAAKVYHPDLNAGDEAADQHLRHVIAAYELLKNPKQRAAYDRYLRNHRRETVQRLALTAFVCAGLVSGIGLAAVAWWSKTQEASRPPQPPHIAAAKGNQAANQEVAASIATGIPQEGDGGGESDLGAPPSNARLPDDGPRHSQQAASSVAASGARAGSQPPLAREWGQLQASGDPMALWAFVARNPDLPEADLARSKLLQLIEAADDVRILRALRIGATGAIAERAQQRLVHLGAEAIARQETAVAGTEAGAEDAIPSKDAAFYLARGALHSRRGDFDRPIADFDQAIRLEPGKAPAYSHRGNAWASKGDRDRTLADYEAAIHIDPGNAALLRDRGILWRQLGDLDRALVDFDHAIRLGFSDAGAYNERGLVWHVKGRHERAIADFNQALKIDPKFVGAFINRGIALRSKGELDRAIADFGQAIGIDPTMPAAYYNRGLARSEKQDFDLATTDFAKARELLPKQAAEVSPAHLP